MEQDKKQSREYVEAVPGPAIVISKETYKKMQENDNAKQNQEKLKERLKKYEKFFKGIKDETKLPEEEEKNL